MNKKFTVGLCTAAFVTAISFSVYGDTLQTSSPAASENTITTTAATPAPAAATAPAANDLGKKAGITPDSILYPVERLIESVQVNLTFYADGKADLLVSFANERLAEAQIMSGKNKVDMVQRVLKVYAQTVQEANKNLEQAAQNDKNITATLDQIKVMEDEAGKIVIAVNGTIPEGIGEDLKASMTSEVKKTLAIKSFATAKESLSEAKKKVEQAKEELKLAEKSGDAAKIALAKENLAKAEAAKEQLEKIKDEIEKYKEEIKKLLDEGDKPTATATPAPTATPSSTPKPEKEKEDDKDNDKIEKVEKQIEKLQEKRQEVINHVSGKPGKAAEKIEENTKKQIEKKQEKIEKFKDKEENDTKKHDDDDRKNHYEKGNKD